MKKEIKISVIIPTYNRAHLLEKTIPTYFQENVEEVIIINDASTDNTEEILIKLKEKYPKIKFFNLEKNSKQTYCKNMGMTLLSKEIDYVYFGDDDSILLPNSINYLYETLVNYKADLVGAKAIYLKSSKELENIDETLKKIKKIPINEIGEKHLEKFYCCYDIEKPIEVLITYACFLIKKEILEKIKFSLDYKQNCYREETDFTLRVHKLGKKLMYDSRACQINLPREQATGGAHINGILGKIKWYYWLIRNNHIFIKKHYDYLKKNNYLNENKIFYEIKFALKEGKNIIKAGMRKILK